MAKFSKRKTYYKGFSTKNWENNGKTFKISNVEVVKDDILNHIFTSKGERIGLPGFGTRIPDLAFEPLDENTISVIEEDLKMVAEYDPRVQLMSLNVYALPNNNAIAAFLDLYYIEFDVQDVLHIEVRLSSA